MLTSSQIGRKRSKHNAERKNVRRARLNQKIEAQNTMRKIGMRSFRFSMKPR